MLTDELANDKFYVNCQTVGCKEGAVHMCTDHQDIALCDSCCMVLHSGCHTLAIVDQKKLLKRTNILVKLIDHIQNRSKLFNISKYNSDHKEELDLISDKVSSFEKQVVEAVTSQAYTNYPYLMKKAREMKHSIDTSMMYTNYCLFMQTRQFNDMVLFP